METQQELNNLEKMNQLRDELRVQMHLAGAELKDQWAKLEEKWKQLQTRLKPVKRAGAESAREVRAATQMLVNELHEGYLRIRAALKEV